MIFQYLWTWLSLCVFPFTNWTEVQTCFLHFHYALARSWIEFGQGYYFFCNLLSLCSDNSLIFLPSPVWRWPMFGQGLYFFAFSCPKPTFVRTEPSSFCLFLSEGESYSDRALIFLPSLVRSRPLLGQNLHLFAFPCPKATHVRTGSHFFAFSCPKRTFVRTEPSSFCLRLSEGSPCSDRALIFLPSLV